MTARRVNLELARLQADTVPMICAKSGVPTDRVRRHRKSNVRFPAWWMWLLLAPGVIFLLSYATANRAKFVLPLAPAVQRMLWQWRGALSLWVAAGPLLQDSIPVPVPVWAAIWWAGNIALFRMLRDAWVAPRWIGVVRLRNAHPEFVTAVRDGINASRPALVPVAASVPVPESPTVGVMEPEQREPVTGAAPAAGWYPDPAGVFDHRWFDGERWTEHVATQGEVSRHVPG